MSLIERTLELLSKTNHQEIKHESPNKMKEKKRKDVKQRHPNTSLKWNAATKTWQIKIKENNREQNL